MDKPSTDTLEKEEAIWKSPHLLEMILYGEDYEIGKIPKNFNNMREYSAKNLERMKYTQLKRIFPSILHWGQLKLLMLELEFIIDHYPKFKDNTAKIILYVGAAPGHHIPFLSELFPDVTFILYDPAKFQIKETSKIKIFNQFFEDKDAIKYVDKNLLFISDIRGQPEKGERAPSDKQILADNKLQLGWFEILKPLASSLKFRFPWDDEKSTYPKGKLRIQVWAGRHSNEMRLILNKPKKTIEIYEYDHREIEERLFYFNKVKRRMIYLHDVPCFCFCYDCFVTQMIIKKYLMWKNNIDKVNPADVCKFWERIKPYIKTMENYTLFKISISPSLEMDYGSRKIIRFDDRDYMEKYREIIMGMRRLILNVPIKKINIKTSRF